MVSSPRAALAHTFHRSQLSCPVDQTEFEIAVTGSYTAFGGYKDFAKRGAIGSLYADMIHACPSCHFAGYGDEFSKPVASRTKRWLFSRQAKKWGKRTLDPAEECEAAADRYVFEQAPSRRVADALLIGTYLLRNARGTDVARRKRYQRGVAKHFRRALDRQQLELDERGLVTYLVAEMLRRTGSFKAALVYYDRVLKEPEVPEWLPGMVNEQRALAAAGNDDNRV